MVDLNHLLAGFRGVRLRLEHELVIKTTTKNTLDQIKTSLASRREHLKPIKNTLNRIIPVNHLRLI